MTPRMWFAALMWLLLVAGIWHRHTRWKHVFCMLSAIVGDIALVLYLQITKDAVGTALAFKLDLLQQVHIGVSSIALVLYFPVLFLGVQLLRGREDLRPLHKRIAITAFIFRTLGFLFMFSMWESP